MGYVPKKKTYRLQFEGDEYDGLEVRMHGLSTGQYMDLFQLKEDAEEDGESRHQLFELMADRLVSWNVEHEDGSPVPATLDGVREQDLPFTMAIIDAWQQAIAGAPAPLPQGSPAGEPSLVASIPTETLSGSPEDYAVPA